MVIVILFCHFSGTSDTTSNTNTFNCSNDYTQSKNKKRSEQHKKNLA